MLSDQVGVALILRIHGNGRVAHDRLRARGGDLQPNAGTLHNLQLEMIKVSFLFLGNDLLIAQGCQGNGAPVDHPLATVNESLLV